MNKIKLLISILLITLCTTGCFKRDELEGVNIYTTVYPITYVTDYLYGDNSSIKSIYPAEVNIDDYSLNKKQLLEYSKGSVFVYNGLGSEKSIARDLLNSNKHLRIIDVSQGLEYEHKVEELWINPKDYLMLAHNIKDGLEDYISNNFVKEEINKKYDSLKLMISGYDAELELIPKNAKNTDIIIASDALLFLDKYGFTVTDVANDASITNINKAKKLATSGVVKYVYMLDNEEETDGVKELVNSGLQIKKIKSMTIRMEDDIKNMVDYKSMMRDNIDAIKEEVFN